MVGLVWEIKIISQGSTRCLHNIVRRGSFVFIQALLAKTRIAARMFALKNPTLT